MMSASVPTLWEGTAFSVTENINYTLLCNCFQSSLCLLLPNAIGHPVSEFTTALSGKGYDSFIYISTNLCYGKFEENVIPLSKPSIPENMDYGTRKECNGSKVIPKY